MSQLQFLVGRRVVAINRFYWPDHSATSQLLTDLAEHLADQGASVTVITSRLRYDDPAQSLPRRETHAGVVVRRIWTTRFGRRTILGRAVDYLTFYTSALGALTVSLRRNDVLIAKTDPPMISVVAALAARLKGAHLINWCQDLFPEVAGALGMKWADGVFGKLLTGIRNLSLRSAAANVVLDGDMADRLECTGVGADQINLIENWCDPGIRPIVRDKNELAQEWGIGDETIIGYSGNLGRAHSVWEIIQLVRHLDGERNLKFLFIGGGAGLETLKTELAPQIERSRVILKPYQDRADLSQSLSVPDLHLISLDPECDGLIFPSKLYGILAAGRGVLTIASANGALARTIRDRKLGLALGETVTVAAADSIRAALQSPDQIRQWGDNARKAHRALSHDGYSKSLKAWAEIIAATTGATELRADSTNPKTFASSTNG